MNKEAEKSIIKKYRKEIWSNFIKALKEFDLISDNDKIAVCISGGKDSFLLAKCMQEVKKHGKINFNLEFIIMDPGYSKRTLNQIKKNLELLDIKAEIFESNIFKYADTTKNPCYICAKMCRGYLYDKAKSLGCNKIALGHHFDDIIETILLNLIFSGNYSTMMPKLKSDNFEGMELIRPLYYVFEKSIINWANYNNLKFIDCACSVSKKNSNKRKDIKKLIEQINKLNIDGSKSIMTSTKNVNLNRVIEYSKDSEIHNFLDKY